MKVARARKHRADLERLIAVTGEDPANRPRCGARFDENAQECVLYVSFMPDLGDFLTQCSAILGDSVHNLNAALNYLSFQLAMLNTGGEIEEERSVQFPICDTPGHWEQAKKRWLAELDPDHISIIESFQGYHRIDEQHCVGAYFHPLSKLRDLAAVDKHRLPIDLVIPTSRLNGSLDRLAPIFLMGFIHNAFRRDPLPYFVPAELGAEITRASLPRNFIPEHPDWTAAVKLAVAIDGNRDVPKVLERTERIVTDVLDRFEEFF